MFNRYSPIFYLILIAVSLQTPHLEAKKANSKNKEQNVFNLEKKKKNKLLRHWEEMNYFGNPVFYSFRKDRSLRAVVRVDQRTGPYPSSAKQIKSWESHKRKLISKIGGMSNWTVDEYKWDKKQKTLNLKGFFMRGFWKKKKKVHFQEWHFYKNKKIIQIVIEKPKKFKPSDDKRISVLLSAFK